MFRDTNFPELLRQRLAEPLPGLAACSDFSPELNYGRHHGPPSHDARQAAVLLLIYRDDSSWHLPLTVRPTSMSSHAGQVSFPGGQIEPGETIEQAALRECCEELGETDCDVQLLGRLSPLYVYASNFMVTPCVAWSPERPRFVPNPAEVAQVLEPTIAELLNAEFYGSHIMQRRSVSFRVPHISYGKHKIWGATRVVLDEFLQIAKITG
jgi:8-oxo-dGTP pyrophosphatase MutT (NUDIX family)